jgi:hypothetical protein
MAAQAQVALTRERSCGGSARVGCDGPLPLGRSAPGRGLLREGAATGCCARGRACCAGPSRGEWAA